MIQVAPTSEIRERCEQHLQQIAPSYSEPLPEPSEELLTTDIESGGQPSEIVSSSASSPKANSGNPQSQSTGPTSLAIGASLAVFISTLWILAYLWTTTITTSLELLSEPLTGSSGLGTFILLEYVVGVPLDRLGEMASEVLFVIVSRFILGFGLSWLPLTIVVAWIRYGAFWKQ